MTSAEQITEAVRRFRQQRRISRVHFAQTAATPPPPLAYVVHFPRLSVTLSGGEAVWLDAGGRAHLVHLRAGEALVVPPDRWDRPTWGSRGTTLVVLFGQRQVGLSLVRCHGDGTRPQTVVKTTLAAGRDEAVRGIMQTLLLLESAGSATTAPLLVDALLSACAELLETGATPSKRRAATLYDSICMYVQEHFQFPITRDEVAAHFRISPTHVSRLFSREGAVSFNDYVAFVRINRAKHLLKNYRQTVDEVATACGIGDLSYFCRVFKRKTGLTPSAYRQAQARAPDTGVALKVRGLKHRATTTPAPAGSAVP